ncbi:hypothetical protein IJ750_01835 [bacterium]|nr:hypothetical protein [bacterium]
MQRFFISLLLLLLTVICSIGSYLYLSDNAQFAGIFFAGLIFGILLMNLKLNVKNDKLKSYKRELEKESVSSDENSAKVKVLESKIEVLEKALENALKK